MNPLQPNPYAPPQAPPPNPILGGAVGACPRCQSADVYKPTFTWWGGLLGPKLINHTVCRGCGFGFNSKTGKSNGRAIAIYFGVAMGIVLLIVVLRAI